MIFCNVFLPQLCLCILLISLHEITLLHNIISATGVLWGCLKVTVGIIAVSVQLRGQQGHPAPGTGSGTNRAPPVLKDLAKSVSELSTAGIVTVILSRVIFVTMTLSRVTSLILTEGHCLIPVLDHFSEIWRALAALPQIIAVLQTQ